MNLLKKLSISTLIVGLSLSLSSCQASDNKEEVKKDSAEIPTITYYDVGTPQEDTGEVVEAINEYLDKSDAGYHLNLQFFDWGEYEQRLKLASNAGDDWDIAFTANWSGPYKNLVEKGAFADITDLIDEKGQAIKDSLSEDVLKGASIEGRLYGAPAAAKNVVPGNYFVWNKAYVDKYKIDIESVKTIKDLEPYLKEVKENEDTVDYPFNIVSDFLLQTPTPQSEATPGVAVKEENGKLIAYNSWADPELKKQLDVLKDYMDKGYINPSAPQMNAGDGEEGDRWLVTKAEGGPDSDGIWSNSFKSEVISSPAGNKTIVTNQKATGSLAAINSQSEHKELAMDFLNRMYSDKELMRYLTYGIEGKHYDLVDGKVEKYEDTKYDVPAFTFLASENMTPLTTSRDQDTPEAKEKLDKFLEGLEPSPILGFNFDRKSVESEAGNVEQTIFEYEKNLKTGAFDEDYYQEFLDKLNTAGIDKLIEEVQTQLDNWDRK